MAQKRSPRPLSSRQRGTRRASAFVLALVALLFPISSRAQPADRVQWQEILQSIERQKQLYVSGRYDESISVGERAQSLVESLLGVDDARLLPGLLGNIGRAHLAKHDYTRAERLFWRSLSIREKALPADSPELCPSYANLGQLFDEKADYVHAESMYSKALTIAEFHHLHAQVGAYASSLASVYMDRREPGDLQRAIDRVNEALLVDPENPDYLNNLAEICRFKGDYARAETAYSKARASFERVLGKQSIKVAMVLNNLGLTAHLQRDYPKSLRFFQQALQVFQNSIAPGDPHLALVQTNIGVVYRDLGDTSRAVEYLRLGGDTRERSVVRMLSSGSESQKLALLAPAQVQMYEAVSLALSSGRPDAAEVALAAVLRRKGRVLDAVGSHTQLMRQHMDSKAQTLLEDLAKTRAELARLSITGPGTADVESHRAALATLAAQEEQIENRIAEKSAEYAATEELVRLSAVQSAIPVGAALVEFSVYQPVRKSQWGPPRMAAAIATESKPIVWVDLGEESSIDAAVSRFRISVQDVLHDPKPAARDLEAKVFAPVRGRLGSIRWVILSPDGPLNLVPFDALVDDGDRYLVERWALSYVTSGRDLLRVGRGAPPRANALVLGDPAFGSAEGTAEPTPVDHNNAGLGSNQSVFAKLPTFPRLSGSASEVEALHRLLRPATVLVDQGASKVALSGVHGPRILHMSTHGFFLRDESEGSEVAETNGLILENAERNDRRLARALLHSGLALAGANVRQYGAADGILTALEASSLDLSGTKLVVLSACETGVGDTSIHEGVYGLRRAFVLAGAETQVVSLWEIGDTAARDLIVPYYRNLVAGQGRAQAMRSAELALLAKRCDSQPCASHPAYWASFIVSGDPGPMEGPLRAPDLSATGVAPRRGCGGCGMDDDSSKGTIPVVALAVIGMTVLRRRGAGLHETLGWSSALARRRAGLEASPKLERSLVDQAPRRRGTVSRDHRAAQRAVSKVVATDLDSEDAGRSHRGACP